MNKNIMMVAIAAIGFHHAVIAQNSANSVHGVFYEVEGKCIYDVKGCMPGTEAAFYSKYNGGTQLKKVLVNSDGYAQVQEDKNFKPAFVINPNEANIGGQHGNGTVSFLNEKEFTLNDLLAKDEGNSTSVTWNAAVPHPENYTFEVLKSVNGGAYTSVATLNATSTGMAAYVYTDQAKATAATNYQIKVSNKDGSCNYTSRPLFISGSIHLYPTVTSGTLNISLDKDGQTAQYKIVNEIGSTMQTGRLETAQSTVQVAGLPSGNYIMQIATSDKKISLKFIKE